MQLALNALRDEVTTFYDGLFKSDIHEEVYAGSGFSNWGYWRPGTKTASEASAQLVDKLLVSVPKGGAVLDAACGSGGTTSRLATMFDAVTAINISAYQVARTQARVPSCRVLQMDATALSFPDASFDAVVCVEAVFHFPNKALFLAEAVRVLKPGGWLVLSDVIFAAPINTYALRLLPQLAPTIFPHANRWNVLAYAAILEATGFNATMESAYEETWQRFLAFHNAFCERKILSDPARAGVYREGLKTYADLNASISEYLLIAAQKIN